MRKMARLALMFKVLSILTLLNLLSALWAPYALAHTTVLFPSLVQGQRGILIVHFHPFQGSGLMGIRLQAKDTPDIKGLKAIYVIHNGVSRDLSTLAIPSMFRTLNEEAWCYYLPLSTIGQTAGDHVIVVKHQPHWKKKMGIYIQKVAKYYINNGGHITDWPKRLLKDMPEIIPLVPPCALFSNGIFRAEAVDNKGQYIPHAKIHVEFLNYKVKGLGLESDPYLSSKDQGDVIIFSDHMGIFSFIPKRPGIWTFTLVDGDKDLKIQDKPLRFDSSISIKIKE